MRRFDPGVGYGHRNGTLEALLEANRGLAGLGPVLPEGLVVVLPQLGPPPSGTQINLWD